MEESNTTSSTTSKKTPLPLRERIVRKAKEKAAITLHELTTNPRQSGVSTNNETTISEANSTIKSPAMKRNNRSYKPFPELNNQQQSDEEQSETEYETPKKQSRTRRKTPATASTTVTKPKGSRLQKQLQAAAANGGGESDITDSTSLLFTQIYEGQTALQALVDDWIESYKREPNGAMLELMRLIVRSSGCKAVRPLASLPRELLKSKEFTECINELVEAFSNDEEQTEQYPLVLGSVAARRFRANLAEFIQLLVNQCQYSIVYDQFMLDVFITFLIALADSQVRAFRHTATLVVLKIMTALVDVLLSLSISKDANQRQYENERSKAASKRANDRIEMLTSKRKELEENEYEIQNFINFIFKAVFIHRYRDVCADIRCICINEIGEWMRKCAEKFLDDTFLKYIGWTLYDRVAECRLKCLQALHPLYEQDDLQARLELFTSRFKNRMVEMTLDRDVDVSVSAIRLLTKIVSRNDAALEDKDCENVYELVYHSNRQIAQAAGGFLNQKLFVKVENPTIEFRRVGGRKQSENGAFIQLLVQFLIESELHDHPTYLVDAMWETHDMLKDWQSMTDLLLEDPVNPEDGLDDLHERYLVEIMCCCVKQAATGEYPVSRRTQLNRKLTAKEAKQVESDRIELTQHFITTLPSLLTKYIADAEKLVYLLQIATHFDLNQYTLNRQEKSLDKLLKLVVEILSKHNDAALLDECSKLLCYVCDEETPIYSKANVTRSSVLDDLVDKFTSAMRAFDQLTEVDENEMYPLQVALKRLAAFADNHDITNYDLVQNTFTILKWAVYNEGFGHELVERALTLARSIITWNMQKLEAECAASAAGEDADSTVTPLTQSARDLIEYISKLSKKFYKLCNKLFVNDNPQIEEEAYFELCDLLILFNINLISVNREYKPLVLECSTNDINMLSVYVMNNVFSPEAATERAETAESIEKLHKRRCILASFCKLISYNSVPIKYAAEIFRGYVKYSASYGDIIKSLLSNCREISKVNTAKTIALALQREYNEAVLNTTTRGGGANRLDRNSVEFTSLKELAHKFCLSFGPEASMKSREAIVAIHHEAINYASESASAGVNQAPVNLPFLEIVTEFSSRLTAQDKKSILNELDKKFAKRANKIDDNNWHAYYVYRLTLMEDYQHQQHQQQQQQNHQTLASTTTVATTNGTSHPTESTTTKTIETADETTAPTTTTTSSTKTVFAAPSVPSSILRRPQPLANSTAVGMSVGRRKETSFDMTGIARIKETRPRATAAAATAAVANDENSYDEEDDENVIDEQNLHADSTMNELAGLKLNAANSGGNHAETNGRRSNRLKGQQTSSNSNTTNSTNSANSANNHKRPRSPLVSTNNSINDSSSIVERDINRFESTRNDGPSKRDTIGGGGAGTSTRGKMSIPITPLHSAVGHVEESSVLGDDVDTTVSGGGAGGPVTKRKRKSTLQNEENNTDTFKPLSVN